jgi:hypothetical protein
VLDLHTGSEGPERRAGSAAAEAGRTLRADTAAAAEAAARDASTSVVAKWAWSTAGKAAAATAADMGLETSRAPGRTPSALQDRVRHQRADLTDGKPWSWLLTDSAAHPAETAGSCSRGAACWPGSEQQKAVASSLLQATVALDTATELFAPSAVDRASGAAEPLGPGTASEGVDGLQRRTTRTEAALARRLRSLQKIADSTQEGHTRSSALRSRAKTWTSAAPAGYTSLRLRTHELDLGALREPAQWGRSWGPDGRTWALATSEQAGPSRS